MAPSATAFDLMKDSVIEKWLSVKNWEENMGKRTSEYRAC